MSDANTFITPDARYIVYEQQAYDPWDRKIYSLTPEQRAMARDGTLRLEFAGNAQLVVDETYDYLLTRSGSTIYWNGKPTAAEAKTFGRLSWDYYKDASAVYEYDRERGLLKIAGMDGHTAQPFGEFIKDKDYLYWRRNRIIRSEGAQILGLFTGYRQGCSRDTRPGSNFYLFRNADGYWLASISDGVVVRNLGRKLPAQEEWYPSLKEKFKLPRAPK